MPTAVTHSWNGVELVEVLWIQLGVRQSESCDIIGIFDGVTSGNELICPAYIVKYLPSTISESSDICLIQIESAWIDPTSIHPRLET
jgi:hypothetical protein